MNPCKELNCYGCCINMVHRRIKTRDASFLIGDETYYTARDVNLDNVSASFPLVRANDYNDRIKEFREEGRSGDKRVDVYIPGKCIHQVNGECDDHLNRAESCKNFEFNSGLCKETMNDFLAS